MSADSSHRDPSPTWHPYRVVRVPEPGPPLTSAQERVLAALTHLCPQVGGDVTAREVASVLGVRFGSVVLTLRNLARRRLATEHEAGDEADGSAWSPTLAGRARVRSLAGRRPL